MDKTSKILIALLVVFILGGVSTSYYFYSKYSDAKKELDLLKKEKDNEKEEQEAVLTGNILIDGEVITEDSSKEETVLFNMNGKQHELSFKYSYEGDGDSTKYGNVAHYYSYKVTAQIFLDGVNISEISEGNKNIDVYFEPEIKTLEDVQNYISSISLMDHYDLQIIKGMDGKEYLFVSVLGKRDDKLTHTTPMVLNSEGKIVYEILDKITSYKRYSLHDPVEQAMFGEESYHVVFKDNNHHEIIALTFKEKENHELVAFKSTITISNNEPKVNETLLEESLYQPEMEWEW